jgi:hypothetical protein
MREPDKFLFGLTDSLKSKANTGRIGNLDV